MASDIIRAAVQEAILNISSQSVEAFAEEFDRLGLTELYNSIQTCTEEEDFSWEFEEYQLSTSKQDNMSYALTLPEFAIAG